MTTFDTTRTMSAPTYTPRSLGTTAFTTRGTIGSIYVITSGTTETDTTGPVVSGIHANWISYTSVALDWDTDEEANCQVFYGTAGQTTVITAMSYGSTHQHYVTNLRNYVITGLTAGTRYYFYVHSEDRCGNAGESAFYTFITARTTTHGEVPEVAT